MTILFTGTLFALQLAASPAPAVHPVQPLAPSVHVQVPPSVFGPPGTVAQAFRDLQKNGAAQGKGEPRVVCGLTIVPADPQVDPKFARERNMDMSFHVRRMSTGLCGDEGATQGSVK